MFKAIAGKEFRVTEITPVIGLSVVNFKTALSILSRSQNKGGRLAREKNKAQDESNLS
jgi:hypothetical protein